MKIIKYSLLAFVAFYQLLTAEIIQVDRLHLIEPHLQQLDQNALVLFDVDYTLTIPDDAILRPCGQKLVKQFSSEIIENPSIVPPGKYSLGYLYCQVPLKAKCSLVDGNSPALIKQLQNRGVRTMALTAAPGGKLGLIESMALWRINELKEFGFDFTSAFPTTPVIEFPKRRDKEYPPLFHSGVLFSSKHSKGDVLKQFLDAIHWYPTKVVFIDDRVEYLQSAETVLKELGIPFTGFHYTAAEKLPCTLDERLAEFQFRYLAEFGTWLSDAEAKQKLRGSYE